LHEIPHPPSGPRVSGPEGTGFIPRLESGRRQNWAEFSQGIVKRNGPAHHWQFLDHTCRDLYETESHVFAHGGLDPNLPLDQQPPAVLRWQTFPPSRPHPSGKTLICGHTPQRSGDPATLPHAICIDTAIHKNGWLTALDVSTGHLWQANDHGEIRESVLRAPKRRW
jgi:serine/threonine protein phosphatase 1